MKTITAEQFAKMYGQESLNSFDDNQRVAPSAEPIEPKLTDIVGQDIAERTSRVGDILGRKDTGPLTKGVQVFGQGAGLAATTLEQTAMKVPGIKQVAQGIGEGINWLTTSDISPIKALGDVIGSNKTLQTAVRLYDTDQNFKDSIDAVANIVRLGGDVDAVVNSANFAANVTNKVIKNVKNISEKGLAKGVATVKSIDTQPASSAIMNKIARLKPTDMTEFERLAGKTPGQYLVDTGNFGTPDKIISTEASKFVTSKNMVDTAMTKLPGVYKYGAVEDALNQLLDTAKNTSTPNVPASYLEEVNSLIQKYKSGGLKMDEINNVKRLYERHVKLGYNKILNPDKVAQATNVDSAIRKWQISKAKDLGFNNIIDMNKQTQLSKFIVDKLGDQVIGQSALNSIGLTDWIVLGSGSPEAVSAFLTKKFFSSRAVQAKIAELLNVGQPVKSIISPDVKPTIESSLRSQWPEGTLLELPPASSQFRTSMPSQGTIKIAPTGSAMDITSEPGINLSSKPAQPPVLEKSRISSSNSSIKNANSQGGFIDIGKMSSDIKSLFQEAKKYKTAEEFVNEMDKRTIIKRIESGEPFTAKLYHGSPDARFAEEFNPKTYKEKTGELYTGSMEEYVRLHGTDKGFKTGKGVYDGISFSDSKDVARSYMDKPAFDFQNSVPMVLERYVTLKNPKVIDVAKGEWKNLLENEIKIAKSERHDGIIFKNIQDNYHPSTTLKPSNNVIVFDAKNIQTKSQLIDIWKKANNKK